MRLKVKIFGDANDWFSKSEGEHAVQDTVQKSEEKLLILTDGVSHRELIAAVAGEKSMNLKDRDIVSSWLQLTPHSWKISGNFEDAVVGKFERASSNTLTEVLRQSWDLAKSRNEVTIDAGEARDLAFDRTFGLLAPLANSIHILDRYATDDMMSRRSWLFSKFLKFPELDIRIWTGIFDYKNTDPAYGLFRIRDKVQEILDGRPRYHADVEVTVFPYAQHHRRLLFQFDFGSINFNLDNGLALFQDPYFEAPTTIRSISVNDFTNQKSKWNSEKKPVATFLWRGQKESAESFGIVGGHFGYRKYSPEEKLRRS